MALSYPEQTYLQQCYLQAMGVDLYVERQHLPVVPLTVEQTVRASLEQVYSSTTSSAPAPDSYSDQSPEPSQATVNTAQPLVAVVLVELQQQCLLQDICRCLHLAVEDVQLLAADTIGLGGLDGLDGLGGLRWQFVSPESDLAWHFDAEQSLLRTPELALLTHVSAKRWLWHNLQLLMDTSYG